MPKLNCYLFYKVVWNDYNDNVPTTDKLCGVILAKDLEGAKFSAKLIKLKYDDIEEIKPTDEDSTIFQVNPWD